MHRAARKQYTDKVYRYILQTRAFTYVYMRVYVYVYICAYTYTHTHTCAPVTNPNTLTAIGVTDVCWVFGLVTGAWWVCVNAQLNKDAPRWSTADVYDKDLR